MDLSAFAYELPPELIAQEPVEPRDAARLLCLERRDGALSHRVVRELPALLRAGDLLVFNDTKVVPARLQARKLSGGAVELLLLAPEPERGDTVWRASIGASHAPARGAVLALPGGWLAELLDTPGVGGVTSVALSGAGSFDSWRARYGRLPLPPYIRRGRDDPRHDHDQHRYQTIYARHPGALAAPTAGLHFTPELLAALAERGIGSATVTLHVGEGTFRPVTVRDTTQIVLHPERYAVGPEAAAAIAHTRQQGGRIVAVGTTTVRTLESRPMGQNGGPEPGEGETTLFVAPGHRFRFVDALLTNFHLPSSTLLMLVCAFAGREVALAAYRCAVAQRYRFYSYGDAMLIQ